MAKLFISTYQITDKVTFVDATEMNTRFQSLDSRLDRLEAKNVIATILIPGTLTTGIKSRFVLPYKVQNVNAALGVGTAPTGAAILVDINKAGTTIFTTQANRPTIADGATSGVYSSNGDITPLAEADVIEIEIDQIGSGVAGADLTIIIRGEPIA